MVKSEGDVGQHLKVFKDPMKEIIRKCFRDKIISNRYNDMFSSTNE